MIVNISGRTDIVTYYSDWLFRRFEEGYALSRNSLFPRHIRKYELVPDKIDCIIFGSKNYEPVLPRIYEIAERFATYFYYTITAYGKDVEPGVPSIDESIETLLKLEKIVGAKKLAWRYDPVLLTEKYTVRGHLKTFEDMSKRLAGHIDRCIFSFVEMYSKHKTNFPELKPITKAEMDILSEGFGKIAKKQGFILQTCGPEEDYAKFGINSSGCVTLDILGRANGLEFRNLKHKGFREGCHCIESRDIGMLNSCPSGCKYCYANKSMAQAVHNYRMHDPLSPLLIGNIKEGDDIKQGAQKSFLKKQVMK